jgi:predicted nuclease of predicted toxin-antitoxin system
MSLSFVIDMNLSVEWVQRLTDEGWQAIHWTSIGSPTAKDHEIMDWARINNAVVFTHDLDFTTLLALSHSKAPSVVQIRSANVLPEFLGDIVADSIRRYESDLINGALIVIEPSRSRIRILPL